MFTIVAQTPKMSSTLSKMFAADDRARAKQIRKAQKEANGARFVVIDAGFPRLLWLVWDCEANDNLRGADLGGRDYPWFAKKEMAQRIADKYNRLTANA